MCGGRLVSLPPREDPTLHLSAQRPSVGLLPPLPPPRNKWINSSDFSHPRGIIISSSSSVEKGETECRKRGECLLNADELRALEVCARVRVCVRRAPQSLVTELEPIQLLLDNTTGLSAPQEKKKQNFLLRIQSVSFSLFRDQHIFNGFQPVTCLSPPGLLKFFFCYI